jgi:MFS family permease
MPHVRRSMLITIAAPAEHVRRACTRELDLAGGDDRYEGPLTGMPDTEARLVAHVVTSTANDTVVRLEASSDLRVPFFTWFLRLQGWLGARRALPYAGARLRAAATGGDAPPAITPLPVVPPVPFTPEQAGRLAALAAVALIASFSGALLAQNGDAVTSAFDRSDQALGVALAVARAGVLVSLVAIALADRWGRRKLILIGLVGACAANLITALAPSFEVFTGAQLVNRALVNTVLIVAGIAAVEEAPEGARAFATGMFALALGAGYGLSVALLPLADLGAYGWRLSFGLSALLVLLVPVMARNLKETRRYERVAHRTSHRGRVGEVFDRAYRSRFVLLGLAAFLTNVFSAPSSQLTNRYLTHAHAFSNSDVAVFRAVTAGLPGVLGVILASRLAESRGRRAVTVVGLIVATVFQGAFFLADGALLLWLAPVVAIVAAACAGLALGTLDTELFPTEVRGTSSGFLLVSGVAGSAVGLVLATQLKGFAGGLGPAIALCGIASLIAAVFVVPRLPETADRRLDDVSPSEV